MIGAATPMVAAPGSRPIAKVDTPINSRVEIRVFLRPMRSPKWPNSTAPTGLAMNATANVANDATVPAVDPSAGKKIVGNTSAAAVP